MTKTLLNSDPTEEECLECEGVTAFLKQRNHGLAATVVCIMCDNVWHTDPMKRA